MASVGIAIRALPLALALTLGFSASAPKAGAQEGVCDLRNRALFESGWAAGNSIDTYFWDQVLPYVGVNGIHTTELAAIDCSNPQRANSENGFSIYRKGFAEGRAQPFDEPGVIVRMQAIKADTKKIKESMMAAQ